LKNAQVHTCLTSIINEIAKKKKTVFIWNKFLVQFVTGVYEKFKELIR